MSFFNLRLLCYLQTFLSIIFYQKSWRHFYKNSFIQNVHKGYVKRITTVLKGETDIIPIITESSIWHDVIVSDNVCRELQNGCNWFCQYKTSQWKVILTHFSLVLESLRWYLLSEIKIKMPKLPIKWHISRFILRLGFTSSTNGPQNVIA